MTIQGGVRDRVGAVAEELGDVGGQGLDGGAGDVDVAFVVPGRGGPGEHSGERDDGD